MCQLTFVVCFAADIKHIVDDAALMNKYDEFMVRRALATDADARWCPAPDCGYVAVTRHWSGAETPLSPHRHSAAGLFTTAVIPQLYGQCTKYVLLLLSTLSVRHVVQFGFEIQLSSKLFIP